MVLFTTKQCEVHTVRLYDAHVHLDFMSNARDVALDAAARGLTLFANTVTPMGFVRTRELVGDLANVRVGLGQHPWWIESSDMPLFDELLPSTQWVGEVGLDFSPKRPMHDEQREAFYHIASRCASAGIQSLTTCHHPIIMPNAVAIHNTLMA